MEVGMFLFSGGSKFGVFHGEREGGFGVEGKGGFC